jgi:S1-C subfamily serine protease
VPSAAASVAFLRATIPAAHPSAQILGEERMGAGVAVTPDQLLTAHYLVLGATETETVGLDGKSRPASRVTVDHDSGLALLTVEGAGFEPARLAGERTQPGDAVFMSPAPATRAPRRRARLVRRPVRGVLGVCWTRRS